MLSVDNRKRSGSVVLHVYIPSDIVFSTLPFFPPSGYVVALHCTSASTPGPSPSMEKNINLAKQVAQAMGYIHARYIVDINLSTRNIFLENDKNKVVISDTGLSH